MKLAPPAFPPSAPLDPNEEIASLIEVLYQTDKRLEQLLAGQIDAVADREGRTMLLRHAQEHLRDSEAAKQAAILNALPAHIALLGPDGIIVSVNECWRRFAGSSVPQSPGHVVGVNYLDICERSQGDGANAAGLAAAGIRAVLGGEVPSYADEYASRSSAEEHWYRMTATPLRDHAAVGAVVMHVDITERRREQAALRELNAELEGRVSARTAELLLARDDAEQANRAKSGFLAAMSHEIRTPMNGVIGMVEVLHQTSLKGYQVEMVDLIRDSAFSLLKIIEDILDFSKIEAGKLSVDIEPMCLPRMVEKVCAMLDHLAVKLGVRMTMFVDPALPASVLGDESRLRQVLVNLVGNAIKFSGSRAQPGRVSVRVLLAGRDAQAVTVDLVVIDNGIGMDAAALAHLFTPFSQADASTTRRFGGTGLGLAISSMLVRLMEGAISVHSVPDEGSTFSVRVRLAVAADAGPGEALPAVQGLQCRIVGAEQVLAGDLATYLVHAGVRVEHAPDLASAAGAEPGTGPWLWLILPGETPTTPELLRALAPGAPGEPTRFMQLGWGKRRRPRVEAADLVIVDADTLCRSTLLKMLGLASGRLLDGSDHDDPEPTAPSHAPRRLDARLQGRLILVAEDNETNRIVIGRQLKLIGYAADVVVNGREALEQWRSGDFALLLTDLHMPQMDGYALSRAIRAEETEGRHMPIIALTANALRDEELRCREAGMDAYLSKPVRLVQLKAAIENWLGPAAQAPALRDDEAPPRPGTLPPDLGVLAALVGDDPAVLDEVLEAFRKSAQQSSTELEEGARAGAMPAVASAAHKLKSGARAIGALHLGELCAEIEQAAQTLRGEQLGRLLLQFRAELASVLQFLDAR